jgi:acetylornithine deacetylase
VQVDGPGGHSSRADWTRAPLAELARLATAYEDWGNARQHAGPAGFLGMCLNVAQLEGGIAFNVIPARGRLTISVRCPPGSDAGGLRSELEALARQRIPDASLRAPVDHPPFGTRDLSSFERWLGPMVHAPIDLGFWTEAALLAGAGIDAVVLGPGDIAQAHSPDEWVAVADLERAQQIFVTLLKQSRDGSR